MRFMDKIAVLIPCYNEEKTIAKVVKDSRAALPEAVIYVYDNNSTDETVRLARESGAIVRHEYRQGKGNVIRTMFREIDAQCYIMVDGDDTYPMESAAEMAHLVLEKHADMVIGDRLSSTYFEENKRPFHNAGNSLVRQSINRLFHCRIKDIMTGYRAFSYDFVKTFPVLSEGFEIETEMTIHAVSHNMGIENVVIGYRDRPEGSVSKLNTYTDGLKVLSTIVRLFRSYRPLGFFSLLSFFLLSVSALLFIPVLIKFIRISRVPNFPTLIVSGFIALAALQSFFTGLMLSDMSLKEKREFEFRLTQVHGEFLRKKGAEENA